MKHLYFNDFYECDMHKYMSQSYVHDAI